MGSSGDKKRDGATSTGRTFRKPMEGSIAHAELFYSAGQQLLTFLRGEPLNSEH